MGTYTPDVDGVLARRLPDLRYMLEGQRSLRLAQLMALPGATTTAAGPGTDAGTADAVAPRAAAKGLRQVLAEIEAAIGRIEDGTYGVCFACWKPIPFERLETMPHARHCASCEERDGPSPRTPGWSQQSVPYPVC